MWFEAARAGDLDTLHICLFWEQRVNALSDDGRTALSFVAQRGDAAAVTLLLERNADPNVHGPSGVRPLTAAIENEHWDIAAALVRAGADPNGDGVASIVIADPPKRQLLALMLRHGLDPHGSHPEWGPYIYFALNDAACADMFAGAGFDLRRYEREAGESLLERALSGGVHRLLHMLSLGADIDLPVDRTTGRTILMTVAAEEPGEQSDAVIQLLAKRGANLDVRDAEGHTALDHARARGNNIATRLLNRLRAEKARAAKAEAKTRAAAEAKAARQRKAEAKKAAAALRAATVKKKEPSPTSSEASSDSARRRRQSRPKRGRTVDTATAKCTPDTPHWSASEQRGPVESAVGGFEEDRNE